MTRTKPTIRTRGHRPLEGVGLTVSCQGTIPTRKQDPLVKAYPGGGSPRAGIASVPRLPITRPQGRPEETAYRLTHTGCSSGLGLPKSGGPIPAPDLPARVIDALRPCRWQG
jgi:hypothetical protein